MVTEPFMFELLIFYCSTNTFTSTNIIYINNYKYNNDNISTIPKYLPITKLPNSTHI